MEGEVYLSERGALAPLGYPLTGQRMATAYLIGQTTIDRDANSVFTSQSSVLRRLSPCRLS